MPILKLILREICFILWVQLLVFGNSFSILEAKTRPIKTTIVHVTKTISPKDILEKSELSYRASGGFTEVGSYAVIISCVGGKISTFRSVHNNRHGTFRKNGTMTKEAYLALWDNMLRRRVFEMKDAPAPRQDILDEFTVHFEAKVGDASNKFSADACSRPEASPYFALRSLLDQATDMKIVWDLHNSTARK
jgi:hypothetical protein